jgi:hypothetical protein
LKGELMSRFRSHLSIRVILSLALLVLASALLAYASTTSAPLATEFGSPAEQEAVRTNRETLALPLRSSCTVVTNKELFITDVSVVDDCWRTTWFGNCATPTVTPARRGAWTLGGLLPGIFGTNDPQELSDLTLRWFKEWEAVQVVNSDEVPARPSIRSLIVDPWLKASGGVQLDMKRAPFRLLAIVSRLDLRQNSSYSEGISAGEARFIFNVLDANGNKTNFNVILEYGLDADNCADVLAWADSWHALGSYPLGDSYNAELQTLTNRFTAVGASPLDTNGSAILRVRTNEIQLDSPWELREFHLKASAPAPAPLVQRQVGQTPDLDLNNSARLATYINNNEAAILAGSHQVPTTFQQLPFRGGFAPHPAPPDLGWDGPGGPCYSINNPQARHLFSLNSCQGCHGDETDTVFKHVQPRNPGSASGLSAFLTGGTAGDRCGGTHQFGDLQRRRVDLCQLLDKTCTQFETEPVVTFTH